MRNTPQGNEFICDGDTLRGDFSSQAVQTGTMIHKLSEKMDLVVDFTDSIREMANIKYIDAHQNDTERGNTG